MFLFHGTYCIVLSVCTCRRQSEDETETETFLWGFNVCILVTGLDGPLGVCHYRHRPVNPFQGSSGGNCVWCITQVNEPRFLFVCSQHVLYVGLTDIELLIWNALYWSDLIQNGWWAFAASDEISHSMDKTFTYWDKWHHILKYVIISITRLHFMGACNDVFYSSWYCCVLVVFYWYLVENSVGLWGKQWWYM